MEDPKIARVGTKGQVVIPQRIRRELGIRSKTKLFLYTRGDKLVLTKTEVPSFGKELTSLFREIDKKNKGKRRPSEEEIMSIIRAHSLSDLAGNKTLTREQWNRTREVLKSKGSLLDYVRSFAPDNELADRLEEVLAERQKIR